MSENIVDPSVYVPDQDGFGANVTEDVVRLYCRHDADGVPFAETVLTPQSNQRQKEVHCDPRTPIPVILIPGVMGTLLAKKDTAEELWWPPNKDTTLATIAAIFSVLSGWFEGAATRGRRFEPESAVVDPRGPLISIDEKALGIDASEARRRGWSTLHRWSYQPTLAWLQETLNNPMYLGQVLGIWGKGDEKGEGAPSNPVLGTSPTRYGAHGGDEAITLESEVFQSFLEHRYPVYAIGYNFLQSNQISGQDVLRGMDFEDKESEEITRIMGIREICRENNTDKAILITHSMGGLVARMASQSTDEDGLSGPGADSILGVVHVAQPATGAPLFAKRFRTGGEGRSFTEKLINQSLFGREAAEFVAIASNAEGPMELAPMPDYNDGKPWWIFVDKQGRERLSLPKASALEEVYIKEAWYGLLPDPSILDPAGVVKKRLEKEQVSESVHRHFKETMKAVVRRQLRLTNSYHPNTYVLYGEGSLKPFESGDVLTSGKQETTEPEEALLTYGTVVWQGDIPEGVDEATMRAARLIDDNRRGDLKIIVGGQVVELTVQKAPVPFDPSKHRGTGNGTIVGDGTVPVWSAQAQGRGLVPGVSTSSGRAKGVQMAFVQGGYEHQLCLDHPWARWATLYSVVQIAHSLKGTTR